jgi:ribosome modulation factor
MDMNHTPRAGASARTAGLLVRMEGEEAARAGEPRTANPYNPGEPERLVWLEGWTQATNVARR